MVRLAWLMVVLVCAFAPADDASATSAPPALVLPDRTVGPDEPLRNMFDGDPDFALGLLPVDIADIVAEHYSGWQLRRDEVGINLRRDIAVPETRNGTFLNGISLFDTSEERLFNRAYGFGLTSPLSGGEVYKINFDITSHNYGSVIASLPDWANRQFSRRGMDPYILMRDGAFSLEYFYDGKGHLLPSDSFRECHLATAGALTLYSHPPEEVKTTIEAIKRTDCVYRVNVTADLDAHGQVYRSHILIMDYRRLTDDILKRVQYGMTPPNRRARKGR